MLVVNKGLAFAELLLVTTFVVLKILEVLFVRMFVGSRLSMARGASRRATPMKAIDLTVFLVELGVPSRST